ncbi:MAG TPA: RsmE family RNA methyltransferase [Synergistales bacterium]|nr:RsmE family RNA methyltransferase [Synergistales bacterium]HRV70437.1 RsmE family RNA methyltransferase [Thermovirgaceae bacterium]
MSLPRVRLEHSVQESDSVWVLDGEQGRHLLTVRRCRDGEFFEGLLPGRRILLRLETCGTLARGVKVRETPEEPMPEIWLLAGLLKGDSFDRLLSQSVEVGASVIVPLVCTRSVPILEPSKIARKMERWKKITLEASKQCCAPTPTRILDPVGISSLGSLPVPSARFVAVAGASSKISEFSPPGTAAVATGPEGDWTEEEIHILQQHDFIPVNLGLRVMRAHTAAVVAVAFLALLSGGQKL